MENKYKTASIYKTIGQVAKELDLIDKKTGQLKTHTIRLNLVLELVEEDTILKKILKL